MATENPNCEVCMAISRKNGLPIYEDDDLIAMLDENPAAFGHIAVMPKKHYPIMEQVPDHEINHLFQAVNRLSVILFETLGVQGTNVLISNGIAAGQDLSHFMVNVIPRKEGDGLNFMWQPKQLSEEEMSTVELVLKEQSKGIGEFQLKPKDGEIVEAEPEVISSMIQKKKAPAQDKMPEGKAGSPKPPPEKKRENEDESQEGNEGEDGEEEENYLIKHLRRIA